MDGTDMASPCAAVEYTAEIECLCEEEFDPGKEVTYTDLQLFTDDFSKEKVMGRTQFGLLYRGIIPQGWKGGNDQKAVAVKMWDTKSIIVQIREFYDFKPHYVLARMKLIMKVDDPTGPDNYIALGARELF